MPHNYRLGILSDIHYAGPAEQARGNDFEIRGLTNPLVRVLARNYRRFIWLREPLNQNALLDRFLAQTPGLDTVIANGDYSCNTAFVGVSDDAACQSAATCLGKLREKFSTNFRATIGDHEVGKLSMFGHRGGMRLASFHRALSQLALEPFWKVETGRYLLIGITSSLVALPLFAPDRLPDENNEWEQLRDAHLTRIRSAFSQTGPKQRVLLFCHDPSALPFLWQEKAVRARVHQVEQTIIGHLHSNLVFRKSCILAGIPSIGFLGPSVKRMSRALRQARLWQPFRVRLCPSLAGIELLKDGGFYTAELDLDAREPARFQFHKLPR
jgi:hypothetical protein